VFDEVKRVLKPSGTCWIVIGDSYAGGGKGGMTASNASRKQLSNAASFTGNVIRCLTGDGIKPKDLCGIPWRLAFALQERGWYLRQDIIWAKPNPMPESVTDRCTRSHEYVFLLTKSARYLYNADAIAERAISGADLGLLRGHIPNGGAVTKISYHAQSIRDRQDAGIDSRMGNPSELRNRRDVWQIQTEPWAQSHFATYPTKLVELCILAGSPEGGVVLDPFAGCGTTGEVAVKLGCKAVLIELNPQYVEMIRKNLGLFVCANN